MEVGAKWMDQLLPLLESHPRFCHWLKTQMKASKQTAQADQQPDGVPVQGPLLLYSCSSSFPSRKLPRVKYFFLNLILCSLWILFFKRQNQKASILGALLVDFEFQAAHLPELSPPKSWGWLYHSPRYLNIFVRKLTLNLKFIQISLSQWEGRLNDQVLPKSLLCLFWGPLYHSCSPLWSVGFLWYV